LRSIASNSVVLTACGAPSASMTRTAGADVVEQHHPVVGLERRGHEAPHVPVAAEPVREHHRAAALASGHANVVANQHVHAP
jgi:hypothetical protein